MARSGVMAAVLCFHQQWVSHRLPQSQRWANTRAKAAAHLTAGAATEAASASLFFLLLRGHCHCHPAVAASASCLRPVPSSSTREFSQRFAPRRHDWRAEGAASQWSRSEAASRPALGLPAEPAAAGSRESEGTRPPPARPERRGADAAGSAGAPGWSRAGRLERDAPDSRRRSRADPGGGGAGRGEGAQQVGFAQQVRLPVHSSPASQACGQVARPER